jgi:hypothetical protein
VPADLEQQLDLDDLKTKAAALQSQLGYSLEPLIAALRPAS